MVCRKSWILVLIALLTRILLVAAEESEEEKRVLWIFLIKEDQRGNNARYKELLDAVKKVDAEKPYNWAGGAGGDRAGNFFVVGNITEPDKESIRKEFSDVISIDGDYGPLREPLYTAYASDDGADDNEEMVIDENRNQRAERLMLVTPPPSDSKSKDEGIDLDPQQYYYHKSAGKGATVIFIDTGINIRHPEFKNLKIAKDGDKDEPHQFRVEFAVPGEPPDSRKHRDMDDSRRFSHGTAVAGLVLGELTGIASQANGVMITALDRDSLSSDALYLSALVLLYEMMTGRYKDEPVVIVNLSLSAGYLLRKNDVSKELHGMLKEIWDNIEKLDNIVITAASGVTEAGEEHPFSFPVSEAIAGKSKKIVVVGGVDREGELIYQDHKSMKVFAPAYRVKIASNIGYQLSAGTSFASALTAGVLAKHYAKNPKITAAELKQWVEENAYPRRENGPPVVWTGDKIRKRDTDDSSLPICRRDDKGDKKCRPRGPRPPSKSSRSPLRPTPPAPGSRETSEDDIFGEKEPMGDSPYGSFATQRPLGDAGPRGSPVAVTYPAGVTALTRYIQAMVEQSPISVVTVYTGLSYPGDGAPAQPGAGGRVGTGANRAEPNYFDVVTDFYAEPGATRKPYRESIPKKPERTGDFGPKETNKNDEDFGAQLGIVPGAKPTATPAPNPDKTHKKPSKTATEESEAKDTPIASTMKKVSVRNPEQPQSHRLEPRSATTRPSAPVVDRPSGAIPTRRRRAVASFDDRETPVIGDNSVAPTTSSTPRKARTPIIGDNVTIDQLSKTRSFGRISATTAATRQSTSPSAVQMTTTESVRRHTIMSVTPTPVAEQPPTPVTQTPDSFECRNIELHATSYVDREATANFIAYFCENLTSVDPGLNTFTMTNLEDSQLWMNDQDQSIKSSVNQVRLTVTWPRGGTKPDKDTCIHNLQGRILDLCDIPNERNPLNFKAGGETIANEVSYAIMPLQNRMPFADSTKFKCRYVPRKGIDHEFIYNVWGYGWGAPFEKDIITKWVIDGKNCAWDGWNNNGFRREPAQIQYLVDGNYEFVVRFGIQQDGTCANSLAEIPGIGSNEGCLPPQPGENQDLGITY
ncbi:hypothetical protein TWF696_005032 [Orbilia brochopaga]|uniref:Peptidase S8/S53 domain-containing protein n=1 Tax=Orbilia brochopaga TaxID=3140254 RepID=A0AAV9V636_9PEZI